MRTAFICGALVALTVTTASAASNQYLCITESVGGLHYDAATQSWKPQGFKAGAKYMLRRITGDDVKKWDALLKRLEIQDRQLQEKQIFDAGDWAFLSFGENPGLLALCKASYIENRLPFACEPSPFSPISNLTTDARQFELVSGYGAYVEQGRQEQLRRDPEKLKREPPGLVSDPSHPDDLSVEIGTCSPF
jgi:hypothetical protein